MGQEISTQELKALEQQVQGLKPWHAKALRYIVLDGMTVTDAAARCGRSRVALSRALRTKAVGTYRALLREELMQGGVDIALKTQLHLMKHSASDLVKAQMVKDTLDRAGIGTENTRPVSLTQVKLEF